MKTVIRNQAGGTITIQSVDQRLDMCRKQHPQYFSSTGKLINQAGYDAWLMNHLKNFAMTGRL